ncbi:hypothetical protein CIHG_06213 [Coccidioides immitis H538.4]|uniref:Uncharacterized protein n=2 Tax=Coccidioides immitis TaxID=5501 RepID=A0A0J8ULI2_COCIT|nr:hypothetical protein CIRG_00148 [Coccidioides immitis RMSCC 2394]KMU88413.1 hypothetical protein CIHG_06213 [Coccidioides immitis H538.4]
MDGIWQAERLEQQWPVSKQQTGVSSGQHLLIQERQRFLSRGPAASSDLGSTVGFTLGILNDGSDSFYMQSTPMLPKAGRGLHKIYNVGANRRVGLATKACVN